MKDRDAAKNLGAFREKWRRKERVPRSLAVLAPLRSSLALARMAASG